ncbi:hypothetical protein [Nocardia carnea]|uniref:hypothetical protein n=1 Tax=Nocardia carnea TaxID=37328 RepID=UPI0024568E31|nr:hypothetical protein [Nocardia carnea]
MSPARSTEQLVLRCYWLVCLAGTIAAVSVTAANNAPPAVAALRQARQPFEVRDYLEPGEEP